MHDPRSVIQEGKLVIIIGTTFLLILTFRKEKYFGVINTVTTPEGIFRFYLKHFDVSM